MISRFSMRSIGDDDHQTAEGTLAKKAMSYTDVQHIKIIKTSLDLCFFALGSLRMIPWLRSQRIGYPAYNA